LKDWRERWKFNTQIIVGTRDSTVSDDTQKMILTDRWNTNRGVMNINYYTDCTY